MSNQANRVYSFYNSRCGLGPQYFVDYLRGDVCPQRKIVLYYRLTISPDNEGDNSSRTNFVTDPTADTYRGISNRYMVDSNYITYNNNLLTVSGYRTPRNTSLPLELQVPDIYNETFNISILPYETNYIQAVADYLDPGTSFETTIPYVNYKVTAASGVFSGFTNMRIDFYNNGNPPGYTNQDLGPVRTVTIT